MMKDRFKDWFAGGIKFIECDTIFVHSMTHPLDTTEGWSKLYATVLSEFALAQMKGNLIYPQETTDEWNGRLESLGIILSKERPWYGVSGPNPNGTVTMSNPGGGWMQIPLETATKILTLGLP